MSPVAETSASPTWLHEAADLLALGYMRARRREAAKTARERRVEKPSNHLAYVSHRATFATGDSATSTEA